MALTTLPLTEVTSNPESQLLPEYDETDVYDVYSVEGASELLDDDEIDPVEHGFMMGYLAG